MTRTTSLFRVLLLFLSTNMSSNSGCASDLPETNNLNQQYLKKSPTQTERKVDLPKVEESSITGQPYILTPENFVKDLREALQSYSESTYRNLCGAPKGPTIEECGIWLRAHGMRIVTKEDK